MANSADVSELVEGEVDEYLFENYEEAEDDGAECDDVRSPGGATGMPRQSWSVDEPELEFDEVGMELSARDGKRRHIHNGY